MANCNFKIPFPKSSEKYLLVAQKAITDNKGVFTGDKQSGNFSIPVGIGDIIGEYLVDNDELSIVITKKPLIVACKLIENRLKSYLQPPVA